MQDVVNHIGVNFHSWVVETAVRSSAKIADAGCRGTAENELSAKEIENVLTVSDDARTASAVTSDESIPPESKTPSGTSETKRMRTESASNSRN